ncbi:MAG: citramalate synthase [Thermodesulfovibrionia bacterium]|nr:citramalate synthase [Thermodesulfovibrionia bacterium]
MRKIELYDTTLRDGAQSEDISFSVEDKLRITEKLDDLGLHFIEGGWPGSSPRDAEFFQKAKKLKLKNSELTAFGSTHHALKKASNDPNIIALLKSGTPVITIFGKSWDFHVSHALKISKQANLDLISNSVSYLKKRVSKVFFDAEHFFDGYKANPEYALLSLKAAVEGGADCLVLCDTNGGMLPHDLGEIVKVVLKNFKVPVGIHAHNDSECAVANSIIALQLGASQVQGTMNGLGERCGNANLVSIIPNIRLKLNYSCITASNLKKLKVVSRYVSEISNLRHFKRQPYVGDSAFAHKGGIHVSAIQRHSDTYEHIKPELVGNYQRILVSDLGGKSNVLRKAKEFNLRLDPDSPLVAEIVKEVKDLENQGFQFEGAEASLELLMKKKLSLHRKFFDLIAIRVIDEFKVSDDAFSEATVHLSVKGEEIYTAANGNGPVNALDNALRKALKNKYPALNEVKLIDYKVRVLAAGVGTSAKVRVLIESCDKDHKWGTVGVSENIIEASWQALADSIEYKLLKG